MFYKIFKLFTLLVIINGSNCYNLDVDFPIIYVDPITNTPNINQNRIKTYFGYSTVLFSDKTTRNSWIKIGAPKGKSKTLYRRKIYTGSVYGCGINNEKDKTIFNNCKQENDPQYNGVPVSINNSFYGTTMDIDAESGDTVICMPRLIYENIYFNRYYMIGGCNFNFKRTFSSLPYYNNDKLTINGVYYYGQGQVGMSVHVSNSGVLMGAPGFANWKGGVVLYKPDTFETFIPEKYDPNEFYEFDYFGYALSSGRFFSKSNVLYVGSAPRKERKGRVVIFYINESQYHAKNNIIQSFTGSSLGEYFGGSLAVLDVNGDGYDDLVVGAPHYSEKYPDEGRIYCYISNQGSLKPADIGDVITGTVSGGQFGLAMKSLGDINRDGYDDIAIGAPYEDEGHGVVYIYNGGSYGLNPIVSQRISGKSVHGSLKGFGISFSNPVDIDGNKHNDIAIGAHISGHVVLLRSRPVISLIIEPKSNQPHINHNDTEVSINICYGYYGQYPPETYINILIDIDSDYVRGYFEDNGKKRSGSKNQYHVIRNQKSCENIIFQLEKNITYYDTPLKISLTPEIIEKNGNGLIFIRGNNSFENKFCKKCPVINPIMRSRETILEIPFNLNCGDDNKCEPDLKVTSELMDLSLDHTIVINSISSLTLHINIENDGETGYNTKLDIQLPENIYLQNIPVICYNNMNYITCDIDNIFLPGSKKTIDLILSLNKITKPSKLDFNITARSQGNELNPTDNINKYQLNFIVEADLKINGISNIDGTSYGGNNTLDFVHTYEMVKSGPSPLEETLIEVFVPVKFHRDNIHFLSIIEPLGYQNNDRFICTTKNFNFTSQQMNSQEMIGDGVELSNLMDGTKHEIKKRSVDAQPQLPPDNRTLFLNCSDTNIECIKITCELKPFMKVDDYARLVLAMFINATVIESHLGYKDLIYITTKGVIKEIKGMRKDETTVSTLILGEMKEIPIETWIYIVSAVCGLLLLIIIIGVFIKIGFFRRTKKEKLEELLAAETNEDFIHHEAKDGTELVDQTPQMSNSIENAGVDCD